MTIAEAAQIVLREGGKPMSIQEIYNEVMRLGLYSFGAKNPKGVMSQSIRERSNANPKAKIVMFKSVAQGIYTLAD